MPHNLLRALAAAAALAIAMVSSALGETGKLVLYTSQPNTDAQQTIDAFRALHPEIDVTFVRDGTPRIIAKLEAELAAGAPQADVLLIADSVTMEDLKKSSRLLAYPEADVSGYPLGLNDTGKMWFATKLITTGIIVNTSARMKPVSWLDLAKPAVKGQLVMPSPLTSGAALIHASTLVSNLGPGWSYYEQLKTNGAEAAGANGSVLKQVAGGEKLYGMVVDFMAIREKAKGAPVDFIFPQEGVSAVTEPVAILKTSKNVAAAKAFVDFLISKQGQELALSQGYVPALPTVAVPPGFPARDTIKLMPFDAAKALAEAEPSRARFTQIFGP